MRTAQVILFPATALNQARAKCRPGVAPRPNHFLADFFGFRFFRQRTNRLAVKLKSGLIRLPVHEALAFHASDRCERAVDVTDTERDTMIVPEIVFGQIAMQVLLFAMLIDAAHPALEDREVAFR